MKPSKQQVIGAIIERLGQDLEVAERAARTAYETATHEENIAENKYDTLGLEASYLAAGQARRVEEIRQALAVYQRLTVRPFDPEAGIQLGDLIELVSATGEQRLLFLGPEAAGMVLTHEPLPLTVITPLSPLGMSLLGKWPGDVVLLGAGRQQQRWDIRDSA